MTRHDTCCLIGLALAVMPVLSVANVLILDDFTVTPWSVTLYNGQGASHDWQGLDKRHCFFGERQVNMTINYNPNHTSLTYSLGNHEQKFTSPLQVAWSYSLEYGNDFTTNVDLSFVDKFMLDFNTIPVGYGPDEMTLSVADWSGKGGTVGWNIRPGGVYFRKSYFPQGIDWHHIRQVTLRQDFDLLPNPTTYSATNFYATLKPGALPPASGVFPVLIRR